MWVPTDVLIGADFHHRQNLPYVTRDKIYGVVAVKLEERNCYYIRWACEGYLNMTRVEYEMINNQIFYPEELELVRSRDDPDYNGDIYLRMFFENRNGRCQLSISCLWEEYCKL